MTLTNPKPEIYTALASLGYVASQSSQNVFNSLPAITYKIIGNETRYTLDNQIMIQEISVGIDIWTEDSVTASRILGEVESEMRSINYRLQTSLDVPSPKGSLYHISATFKGLR